MIYWKFTGLWPFRGACWKQYHKGLFMLYKNVSKIASDVSASTPNPTPYKHARLSLVVPSADTNRGAQTESRSSSSLLDLAVITSRRCSSFFAEAAVLVLVFGILDFFILKGRIELSWIVGALAISVGLLTASIATDFSAHRWIKAHP
jgi:hypothetical protein